MAPRISTGEISAQYRGTVPESIPTAIPRGQRQNFGHKNAECWKEGKRRQLTSDSASSDEHASVNSSSLKSATDDGNGSSDKDSHLSASGITKPVERQ